MSAEGAALDLPDPAGILTNARSRRIVRFALGTTLGSGLAYLIGFDLPFLVPILVAMLLASPAPCPSVRKGLAFVVPVAVGAFLGVVLTRYFLKYPLIFLLMEFLVLYRIFYALAGGAAPLRMVWLLIAALIIPLMGQASIGLSIGVALGLVKGTVIAILAVWLSFGLLPDPPAESPAEVGGLDAKPAKQAPPPAARAAYARRTLIVLFPIVLVFFTWSLYSHAVILVYVGLLSLLPSFAAGWKQGKGMITGNLIGGIVAIVFYNLLTGYPEFVMFLLLTLIVGITFGDVIFSTRPIAPTIKTAFNAVMLLVGMSLTGSGSNAASNFYARIAQVMLAVVYVAAAFGFLEYLQRKRVKKA
jgi:uncharacterized membrane protein YgaE (UPF0421/DUF939 family)